MKQDFEKSQVFIDFFEFINGLDKITDKMWNTQKSKIVKVAKESKIEDNVLLKWLDEIEKLEQKVNKKGKKASAKDFYGGDGFIPDDIPLKEKIQKLLIPLIKEMLNKGK